jgi:tripartite-type tricarboxylate transporter receptor subunit TctC
MKRIVKGVAVAATCFVSLAAAQTASTGSGPAYPSKPIHLIVPFPAGGPSDLVGRELAAGIGAALGQTVIVENRSGANGAVGAAAVARAAPDGYTIMFQNMTSHLTNPWVYKQLPYDTVADFTPITQVASSTLLVAAHPAFPAKTIAELIALAKAKPGTVGIASFGAGSMAHLGIELLKSMAGVDVIHVPYKGGAPAVADALAGHVPVAIVGLPVALPLVQQGRLRALAVTGRSRAKQLPDVPTVSETPGLAGYDASLMYGLWAPAKTPAAIVGTLHDAAVKLLRTPEVRRKLEDQGMDEVIANTPEQMAANIRVDMEKIGNLVRASGLQPE